MCVQETIRHQRQEEPGMTANVLNAEIKKTVTMRQFNLTRNRDFDAIISAKLVGNVLTTFLVIMLFIVK